MLSVALGPGLLSTVFDGLQNPLADIAAEHGFFLPRGVLTNALDQNRKWSFEPKVKSGDGTNCSLPHRSLGFRYLSVSIA